MSSRDRILRHLAGQPVDRLPVRPITMMLAARRSGARYRDDCTDYRVLAAGQLRIAEEFGFDYVNTMSDPAREQIKAGAELIGIGDAAASLAGPMTPAKPDCPLPVSNPIHP